jgi:hypothetical protein
MAQLGCPPDSPARNSSIVSDPSSSQYAAHGFAPSSFHSYVQIVTSAKDLCYQVAPHEMHGAFEESTYLSATHQLIPIFGSCKLPLGNDILIPSTAHIAANHENDTSLSAMQKNKPWDDKASAMVWHGIRRDRNFSSTHSHPDRFVAIMDAGAVREMKMRLDMRDHGLNPA